MSTYRTGGTWRNQTIILVGVQPANDKGHRPDDQLVALVDSGAPEGLAAEICGALKERAAVRAILQRWANPDEVYDSRQMYADLRLAVGLPDVPPEPHEVDR